MSNEFTPTEVARADVYKAGKLAAHLTRTATGVEFAYTVDWLRNGGPPIATTLPVLPDAITTLGGAVPAYFAGLLPEGRRSPRSAVLSRPRPTTTSRCSSPWAAIPSVTCRWSPRATPPRTSIHI